MDELYNNLYGNNQNFDFDLNLGVFLKVPLIIFLIGNVFYTFMLVLKIRILVDTVEAESNNKMKMLAYINLFVSIGATILGLILILLG